MSKEAYEKKLEALQALRFTPKSAATEEQLRKALRDRNNYLVSKAAPIVAELSLPELIPDLVAAFERFLTDPVKTDPQCWAKNAISKALKDLGHREAQVFLRGIPHIQMEPVWGGVADSAGTLRGTCALALVDCEIDDLAILTHLTDRLADAEKPVRIDAATAIAQLGRIEGALLLRLKALLGDVEPDVLGQCFVSLLSLDPQDGVGFVAQFLEAPDEDVKLEAASALAQSREPRAIELLKEFWKNRLSPQLRQALLVSLGASPLPEAAGLLLSVVADGSNVLAATALSALASSRFRAEFKDRAAAAVKAKQEESLERLFEQEFRPIDP